MIQMKILNALLSSEQQSKAGVWLWARQQEIQPNHTEAHQAEWDPARFGQNTNFCFANDQSSTQKF